MQGFNLKAELQWVQSLPSLLYPRKAAHLFRSFERNFDLYLRSKHEGEGAHPALKIIQDCLIAVIFADHRYSDSEERLYERVCHEFRMPALRPEEVLSRHSAFSENATLSAYLPLLQEYRKSLQNPHEFCDFLNGLWCLAFANGGLNPHEYDFIVSLYDEEYDILPRSFLVLKKEIVQ